MVNESRFDAIAGRLLATRCLAALAIANALSFSLCNGLGLTLAFTPWIYAFSLAAAIALLRLQQPRRLANLLA